MDPRVREQFLWGAAVAVLITISNQILGQGMMLMLLLIVAGILILSGYWDWGRIQEMRERYTLRDLLSYMSGALLIFGVIDIISLDWIVICISVPVQIIPGLVMLWYVTRPEREKRKRRQTR